MCEGYVAELFQDAKTEELRDGYDSRFEQCIKAYVHEKGIAAIIAIGEQAENEGNEIGHVALRSLGELDHLETSVTRRLVLQAHLKSESYWIRDGAILGLAWMDDPASIPALVSAARRETISALKDDIIAVIDQLEESRNNSAGGQ